MSRTFLYELKKMMLVRKGLWMIVLFFLLNIITLFLTDAPENEQAEYHKADYTYYLKQVEGEYTSQKAEFLENKALSLEQSRQKRQMLYDAYYDGTLAENSFQQQLASLNLELGREQGFQILYDQYLYIHENPENRYFLPTNGWHGLLAGGILNFFLVALLLLLVTPVFCHEYSCQMELLLLTARQGRKCIYEKLLLVLLVMTGIFIGYSALRYGFYAINYGLPHGEYPLQSIPYFGNSTKTISLQSAFLFLCAVQWFGCLFLCVIILFLSAITKKYALTVFLTTAAVILPYLGFSETTNYLLPAPLSYLLGSGFLKGSEFCTDFLTGELTAVFEEISISTFAVTWTISIFLCMIGILLLLHQHQNRWNTAHIRKKGSILLFCCLMAGCFSGCEKTSEIKGIYNQVTSETYEYNGNRYYYDIDTLQFLCEGSGFSGTELFTRTPMRFLSSSRVWPCLFGAGTKIYYMQETIDSYVNRVGRFSSTIQTISIIEVDTVDFQEKIIFEQNISDGRSYLGIEIPLIEKWDFLFTCTGFFLNQHSLFFVGNDIRQFDRMSGKLSVLPISSEKNIAFDGEFIYFIGDDSTLMRYDPVEKKSIPLSGVTASEFYLAEHGIYFLNRKDQNKIYFCNTDGTGSSMILNDSVNSFSLSGQKIYFRTKDNQESYCLDLYTGIVLPWKEN